MQSLPPGPSDSAWLQVWRYFRDPNAFFAQCQRDYGDAFTMRYPGNPPLVLFSHPTAVKEILTADPNDLRAGEANVILRNVVGDDSLFVLDGPRHDHHRRAMMPLFHGERLRAHAAPMTKAAALAVRALPRKVHFRAQPWLESMTLDMILGALFADSPKHVLEQLRYAILKFTQLATSELGTLAAMLIPVEAARQMTRSSARPFSSAAERLRRSLFCRAVAWSVRSVRSGSSCSTSSRVDGRRRRRLTVTSSRYSWRRVMIKRSCRPTSSCTITSSPSFSPAMKPALLRSRGPCITSPNMRIFSRSCAPSSRRRAESDVGCRSKMSTLAGSRSNHSHA
jgi:Cytochrome P450